jgi:hypothetical protein
MVREERKEIFKVEQFSPEKHSAGLKWASVMYMGGGGGTSYSQIIWQLLLTDFIWKQMRR